ncbi:MAG: GNAT family N-acetyltransferase [Opitutales bacterium]
MLALAPFTLADADWLIGWVPDERFLLQWSGPQYTFPLTQEQLAQTWAATQQVPTTHLMFTVRTVPDDRVIGHVELVSLDLKQRRAHVARVLIGDPSERRRGRGTELMQALVRHAFGPLGLETLTLAVFTFNAGAIACYRRVGFVPAEERPEPRRFGAETWDLIRMRLDRPAVAG